MLLNNVGSGGISDTPSRRYATAGSREPRLVATIQRIAEGIIGLAPLFWLALIVAFVAVTLGIIPNG